MIVVNKLDNKTFGPFASSTGFFMLIGGLIAAYFNLLGLLIATIGAFISFTSTKTIIDTVGKRIKHADYLFGILPFGKWIHIQPNMKLGLKKVRRGYVGYIRGTQPMDIQYTDIRIFLYDPDNKPMIPVKRFKSFDVAKAELAHLATLLELSTT